MEPPYVKKILTYHSGLWSLDIDAKNTYEEMVNIQFREA